MRTTFGARSRSRAGTRDCHRSGGSITWSSTDTIRRSCIVVPLALRTWCDVRHYSIRVASSALAGIRICDLSGQLAGAGATRYLAAFGAQVIRVEDPVRRGGWDILRGSRPFVDERRGPELGGAFNNHNVGKLGVTIDLRTDAGRDLFARLVAVSDVVTENFAAGVLASFGFPYERLREINPSIIYASNSGFGHEGPYAAYK